MYVHVADQTLPCFQGLSSNLCRCTVDACFFFFYIYFSRAQFCEIYIYTLLSTSLYIPKRRIHALQKDIPKSKKIRPGSW